MPIKLMPIYRRGGHNPYITAQPITGDHPALIRSPRSGRGRYEARWHRVKSAATYAAGHTIVHVWCGQAVGSDDAFTTDDALDGFPVCGACEGRAMAVGLPGIVALLDVTKTGMVFEPDCVTAFKPPKACPGSTNGFLMLPAGVPAIDVAKCGACGVLAPIRTGREYWNPAQMLKIHAPGVDLVPPCEQHAWDDLVLDGENAVCRCKRDGVRDGVVSGR